MDELMKQKHPSTWVEFELGKISEAEVFEVSNSIFFILHLSLVHPFSIIFPLVLFLFPYFFFVNIFLNKLFSDSCWLARYHTKRAMNSNTCYMIHISSWVEWIRYCTSWTRRDINCMLLATIQSGTKSLRTAIICLSMGCSGASYLAIQVWVQLASLVTSISWFPRFPRFPLTFSSPSPFHTHISAGLRKPDPQSYLNACAELNKRPSECVSTSTKKNKTNETTERDIIHECFLMQERYL